MKVLKIGIFGRFLPEYKIHYLAIFLQNTIVTGMPYLSAKDELVSLNRLSSRGLWNWYNSKVLDRRLYGVWQHFPFCGFLEKENSLETLIVIFEKVSLKGFFWLNFEIPFWRQILDIYRQPLLNVLNEVKNNKLGNCCSFCILLSTCWPDFICERQSLENNPGVLPDTPIMHRFCHPKLCTTYCFWFHQGITVVLREINKRQCLCEILGDKTEVYYGRCANTERSPVVARWNPSEGGDRGGLETRVASAIFGSWDKWRISLSTFVVGLVISNRI